MSFIPERLAAACRGVPERVTWLAGLPHLIPELEARWELSVGEPWNTEASCSWVAPAVHKDGTHVVLKLGMPHMEADSALHAMVLERCEPGTSLCDLPDEEADLVIADLLRGMWRRPPAGHPFRPLSMMLACWVEETLAARAKWTDPGLVQAGLRLFEELSVASSDDVLLATDLHAGNVLRAHRARWLVIDPKPFVGDRAYDATQHLFNCQARMAAAPSATIRRFADLLGVDDEPVRLWMLARSAAEPREIWTDDYTRLPARWRD